MTSFDRSNILRLKNGFTKDATLFSQLFKDSALQTQLIMADKMNCL